MSGLSLNELLSKVGNRYQVVLLASRRARKLGGGAKPLVRIDSKKLVNIALAEIAAGKIKTSFSAGDASKEHSGDREEEKRNQEDNRAPQEQPVRLKS